jgi:hypothetical protein
MTREADPVTTLHRAMTREADPAITLHRANTREAEPAITPVIARSEATRQSSDAELLRDTRNDDIHAFDERYCRLAISPSATPFGFVTDDDGTQYPAAWINVYGTGKVIYSALGHGPESYDSPSHQELLRQLAQLLTLS